MIISLILIEALDGVSLCRDSSLRVDLIDVTSTEATKLYLVARFGCQYQRSQYCSIIGPIGFGPVSDASGLLSMPRCVETTLPTLVLGEGTANGLATQARAQTAEMCSIRRDLLIASPLALSRSK
jgi:hypothetical protein